MIINDIFELWAGSHYPTYLTHWHSPTCPTQFPSWINLKISVQMAANEPKTVPPDTAPKSTANISEAPTAASEPKTQKDVSPKTEAPKSEAPKAGTEPKTETDAPPANTPKVSQIKTVKVSNISVAVTKKDIWEFFNFSGDIHYIEMKSESETTQQAFVTFKESQGADTAVLLTGATIADLSVSVSLMENYQLPPDAPPTDTDKKGEVVQKAEEVVSTMLAKGYVLGKDALKKAQSFDEKHQFTSNASAKVADLDRKMGLSQKLKEVNERYQVSEKTQSAIAVAEQKANTLMANPYVSSGAVWFSGAFAAITKAAEGVGNKTKEKVDKEEKERSNSNSNINTVNNNEKQTSNSNSTTVNNSDESLVKGSPVNSKTVNSGDKSSVVKDKSSSEKNKLPEL
ncbi:unnamed protein product [Lactuca saligna]|uniref:RRM domain-containing protein n=1 Tax=Lactuca saligna TaxID=75948 RepID=A0AA35UYE8_LACSI|nr:unnamed protein product [Lactuca saligna]